MTGNAVTADMVGVAHTRVTTVRRDDVEAFAGVLGEPGPADGSRGRFAPLGFVAPAAADAVLACLHDLMRDPSVTGLLQVAHDQVLDRRLEIGEDITTTALVTDRWAVPGGTLARLAATITGDRGPVGRSTGALLVTGLASGEHRSGRHQALGRRDVDRRSLTACGTIRLSESHARDYAAVSRDPNPIHRDDAAARAAGHPGVIVPGLCLLWLTAARVVDRFADGDPGRVARISCRFAAPGLPGDRLEVRAGPVDDRTIGFRAVGSNHTILKSGAVELRPSAPGEG